MNPPPPQFLIQSVSLKNNVCGYGVLIHDPAPRSLCPYGDAGRSGNENRSFRSKAEIQYVGDKKMRKRDEGGWLTMNDNDGGS